MQSAQTQALLANIIWLGRLAGAAIIVIGILFAIWDASDLNGYSSSYAFRLFIRETLQWLGTGGALILLAEVADRLGKNRA